MDADEFKKRFAQRLTDALHDARLGQSDLARRLDIPVQNVQHWVKGRALPNAHMLSRILPIIDKSADWMLFGHQETGKKEGTGLELLACWELLTPNQQHAYLAKIKEVVAENRAIYSALSKTSKT